MEYDNQLYALSSKFQDDYPIEKYPEFLYKPSRPYNCLLIDSHDGYFICIPYRSNIKHANAFFFKHTHRSIISRSGLDYSKIVLINNIDYLSDECVVDHDEYVESVLNIKTIVHDVSDYICAYKNHMKGIQLLHKREYSRKYKYSTLKYFHNILHI